MLMSVLPCLPLVAQQKEGPYALFQGAILTGAGNALSVLRLPVVIAPGNVVFKNVLIQFQVDVDGNLSLVADSPQVSDAPALASLSFKPGSYVGPGAYLDGKTPGFVDGPGPADGGATSWSFTTAGGADACTYPRSATWYVGPLENTPVAARLKKAGITSTAWSYGIANGPGIYTSCTKLGFQFLSSRWGAGTLIGVSQTGNAITIASFTDNQVDSNAPVDQVTFRLVP